MLLAVQPIVLLDDSNPSAYELLARRRASGNHKISAGFIHDLSREARVQFDLCLADALPDAVYALMLSIGGIPDYLSFNVFCESLLDTVARAALLNKVALAQQMVSPTQLVIEFNESLNMPWIEERKIIKAFQGVEIQVAKDDHSAADGINAPRLTLPWNWVKLDMTRLPIDDAIHLIRSLKRRYSRRHPITVVIEQCYHWSDTLRLKEAGADAFQAFHHGRPFLLPAITKHPDRGFARICRPGCSNCFQ